MITLAAAEVKEAGPQILATNAISSDRWAHEAHAIESDLYSARLQQQANGLVDMACVTSTTVPPGVCAPEFMSLRAF